jgi:hypothetical protein
MAVANGYDRGQSAKVLLVTVVALAVIGAVTGLLADRLSGPLVSRLT